MPLQKENITQKQAFEEYFWMRPRSIRVLGKNISKNQRTISAWAKRFNWADRIERREKQIMADMEKRNDSKFLKAQDKQLAIAQAVLARFAVRLIKDKKVRTEHDVTKYEPTAADAVKWASQQMLLLGAATSRTEVGLSKDMISGLLAAITAAIRRVVPANCPHCKTNLGLQSQIAQALIEASHRFTQAEDPDPSARSAE